MKCEMCKVRDIEEGMGNYCVRCDQLVFDAMMEMKEDMEDKVEIEVSDDGWWSQDD